MIVQKQSISRVDILKEKIDKHLIEKGLKPSVWKSGEGCGCYILSKKFI